MISQQPCCCQAVWAGCLAPAPPGSHALRPASPPMHQKTSPTATAARAWATPAARWSSRGTAPAATARWGEWRRRRLATARAMHLPPACPHRHRLLPLCRLASPAGPARAARPPRPVSGAACTTATACMRRPGRRACRSRPPTPRRRFLPRLQACSRMSGRCTPGLRRACRSSPATSWRDPPLHHVSPPAPFMLKSD